LCLAKNHDFKKHYPTKNVKSYSCFHGENSIAFYLKNAKNNENRFELNKKCDIIIT